MEFRSEAYSQMAGIELQLHNPVLAKYYANQSLDFNRFNFNTLKILTIIYRQNGEVELADRMLENITSLDPLNHFAGFEHYRLHPSPENLSLFTEGILNEFPYQTFLELAIGYYNLGLKEDALLVLKNAPEHPLVELWKAYLNHDPSLLNEVINQSSSFVFPYRTETVAALTWAVANNNNWKFKYYLGLNYWSIQRKDDALKLFMACGTEPDFAPFYLSRANLMKATDDHQELSDLQKAKQLGSNDWRNWKELIEYYENSTDYKTALLLSTEAIEKFKGNFNLELLHAKEQLNNDQYKACVKTLENTIIIPFEGSIQGKYVYEQAYILIAIDLMNRKKYKEALLNLEKSKAWPENLGIGAPFEPDNRMQEYLQAICQDKSGQTNEAEKLRNSILNFTKTHHNNSENGFNNLFTLLIFRQRGDAESANTLIQTKSQINLRIQYRAG